MREMNAFEPLRFSQIPNRIFDYWIFHLSGAEFKVLCYIARRTYGFNREKDQISLSQICDGIARSDGERLDWGTGLSRKGAIEALSRLTELGLVVQVKAYEESEKRHFVTEYRLNVLVDADEEGGGELSTPGGVVTSGNQGGGSVLSTLGVVTSGNQGVVTSGNQQNTVLIQNTVNKIQYPPIVPPEEPPSDNPPQPTDNPPITVDNICEAMHTAWQTVFGSRASLGKDDIPTLEDLASSGKWSDEEEMRQEIADYREKILAQGGKPSVAKFLVFVQGGEIAVARKNKTHRNKPQTHLVSRGGYSPVSNYPPIQPASSKREIPPQANEWNEAIPDRAWVAWDSKLDAAMRERLADADFVKHWPTVLAKCKEIVAKKHPKNGYVTFPWVLKEGNWASLLNGVHDFLLRDESQQARPAPRTKGERALELIQRAKAYREDKRGGE